MSSADQNAKPACVEFDSGELLVRLDVTVPADVKAISPLVERVLELAAEMECASGKEFEIETALREALANAIRHGCQGDSAREIECCVACDSKRGMLIIVRDPGPGFEPDQIRSPTVGENVFSHHGRGIYLINQLMDEVSFHARGTEIRMRKA